MLVRGFIGREVMIAYGVLAVLYLVRVVGFTPIQLPAYLLIASYDVIERALPVITAYYAVGFPLYLYGLAVIGGALARVIRSDGDAAWLCVVGGVCLVIGSISLLFGAMIGGPLFAPTDNPTPLAITGATGIVLVLGGWWLLGRPLPRRRPSH